MPAVVVLAKEFRLSDPPTADPVPPAVPVNDSGEKLPATSID